MRTSFGDWDSHKRVELRRTSPAAFGPLASTRLTSLGGATRHPRSCSPRRRSSRQSRWGISGESHISSSGHCWLSDACGSARSAATMECGATGHLPCTSITSTATSTTTTRTTSGSCAPTVTARRPTSPDGARAGDHDDRNRAASIDRVGSSWATSQSGGIGRHAALRMPCFGVGVRVPPLAHGVFRSVRAGRQRVRCSRRIGIMARKARPRCEMAFFSTSVYSASERVSPSGTNTGS